MLYQPLTVELSKLIHRLLSFCLWGALSVSLWRIECPHTILKDMSDWHLLIWHLMLPVPLTVNWYWLECPPCLSSWFARGIQEGAPIANTVNRVIPLTFYASEKCICQGNFRQYPLGITRPLELRPIFGSIEWYFLLDFLGELLPWNFIPKKSTPTSLNTLAMLPSAHIPMLGEGN